MEGPGSIPLSLFVQGAMKGDLGTKKGCEECMQYGSCRDNVNKGDRGFGDSRSQGVSMQQMIIPALIALSQKELDALIRKVWGLTPRLQLDIMDGKFVPNHSLDFDFQVPDGAIYEAHLMVSDPWGWIETQSEKVDVILVHIETCQNLDDIVDLVRGQKKIGFAVNPQSSLTKIIPLLDKIDQVLIMTVEPGFYGSPFVPEALRKVQILRSLKPGMDIEVDGSINPATISQAYHMGANLFVSGSYLMKAKDIRANVTRLQDLVRIDDV